MRSTPAAQKDLVEPEAPEPKRRTLLNEGQLFFDKCAVAKDEARAQRDRDPATGLASPHPAYAGRRQSLVEESESDESSL